MQPRRRRPACSAARREARGNGCCRWCRGSAAGRCHSRRADQRKPKLMSLSLAARFWMVLFTSQPTEAEQQQHDHLDGDRAVPRIVDKHRKPKAVFRRIAVPCHGYVPPVPRWPPRFAGGGDGVAPGRCGFVVGRNGARPLKARPGQVRSAERRCVLQAALGPQRVQAAGQADRGAIHRCWRSKISP
jgi:hypothetical protein